MIARLRRADAEQHKLILSLGTNFLTRIPGAVGLLWFLPLMRFGLGTDDYTNMLAAMALASVAAFLASGFNLMGRRMVGEAYANGDHEAEADALASVVIANILAAALSIVIIVIYCELRGESTEFLWVASLTAVGSYLMLFENVRSAYNEHYVTALLFIVIQSTTYATGLMAPATRHDILLGSLIIQSPYWLASLMTLVLLLRDKPYLMRGRPIAINVVMRQGTMLSMADGFLFATLSLSVVWMQTSAAVTTAAWYATIVRLFQTFLVPVALIMLPLAGYIRILWKGRSVAQQRKFTKATLAIGIGYGAFVALGLFVASQLYVGWVLRLPVSDGWPIFFMFGAIVAYKSYSTIAYVVLDEATHLSTWTAVAVGAAVVLGAAASIAVEPLGAIDVYALVAGAAMLAVLLWNAARFVQPAPMASV
jgi:hypothetical protein